MQKKKNLKDFFCFANFSILKNVYIRISLMLQRVPDVIREYFISDAIRTHTQMKSVKKESSREEQKSI